MEEIQEIDLQKGEDGLGFNIRGGRDAEYVREDNGIFVTKIREKGSAAKVWISKLVSFSIGSVSKSSFQKTDFLYPLVYFGAYLTTRVKDNRMFPKVMAEICRNAPNYTEKSTYRTWRKNKHV